MCTIKKTILNPTEFDWSESQTTTANTTTDSEATASDIVTEAILKSVEELETIKANTSASLLYRKIDMVIIMTVDAFGDVSIYTTTDAVSAKRLVDALNFKDIYKDIRVYHADKAYDNIH